MKSIFYAHGVSAIGGAERVTLAMIDGLKSDYDCHMLALSDGDLENATRQAGAVFHPIHCFQPEWKKPLKTAIQFTKYYRLLKKYKPLFVHVGDLLALRSLTPICTWLGIPIVCHVHFPYREGFMRWGVSKNAEPAGFIFCSEELQRAVGPYLKILSPNAQQQVIHNVIDINRFDINQDATKSTLSSTKRIGIVANLQVRKGHEDFLNMAAKLVSKGFNVHFDIIGGDILQSPREPQLKAFAEELGLNEHVTFHGQLGDVRKALADLDIVVCASHEEAFPISILEAMSCGKVIVSTNVNGIPEAITHEVNGLLVEPHAPAQLASAVGRILSDEALAKLLGECARETAVDCFSHSVFIQKIRAFYASLL